MIAEKIGPRQPLAQGELKSTDREPRTHGPDSRTTKLFSRPPSENLIESILEKGGMLRYL